MRAPSSPLTSVRHAVRTARGRRAGMLALAMTLACSSPSPSSGSAGDTAAAFHTVVTTRQLMEEVMEPAANVYWEAVGTVSDERGSREIVPATDSGWIRVRNAATVVAEAGNLLMIPARAANQPDWIRFSRELIDVAARARTAADRHDAQAVFDVGAEMYEACVNCHAVYLVGDKATNPALRPANSAPR
jgi:hypothetical protein